MGCSIVGRGWRKARRLRDEGAFEYIDGGSRGWIRELFTCSFVRAWMNMKNDIGGVISFSFLSLSRFQLKPSSERWKIYLLHESIDLYYPVNLLKRKVRKFYISERCKIYLLSISFYSLLNLNQTKDEKFLYFGKIYLLNLLSINFYYPLNLVKRKIDNFYTSEKCKIYLLSFNFYYLLNLVFLDFWNM